MALWSRRPTREEESSRQLLRLRSEPVKRTIRRAVHGVVCRPITKRGRALGKGTELTVETGSGHRTANSRRNGIHGRGLESYQQERPHARLFFPLPLSPIFVCLLRKVNQDRRLDFTLHPSSASCRFEARNEFHEKKTATQSGRLSGGFSCPL